MTVPASDWLSRGGAYTIVFAQTIIIIAVGWVIAMRIGKSTSAEGDGCLLGIANTVLTALGAGIGFFASQYPYFVVTSLIGAAAMPTIGTAILSRRIAKS